LVDAIIPVFQSIAGMRVSLLIFLCQCTERTENKEMLHVQHDQVKAPVYSNSIPFPFFFSFSLKNLQCILA